MLYFCVQTSCDCFLLSGAHDMLLDVSYVRSCLVMASAKCETSLCQAAVCHECELSNVNCKAQLELQNTALHTVLHISNTTMTV